MKVLPVILGSLLALTSWASATVIGDRAAQMQPGTWAELTTNGFSGSLLENGGIGDILGYSDSAMWDPIGENFLFRGAPHCGGSGNCQKYINFNNVTNTWTSCSGASGNCPAAAVDDLGHSYDHNVIDPATRTWYHRLYNSARVQKFDLATNGPWVDIAPMVHGYTQVAGALAWFPELYSGSGGLVFAQGGYGEAHLWNKSQNKWTQAATGLAMGPYHNFAEYNPIHKVVIFGGGNGSSDLYKVTAGGVVTKMRNAPIGLGIHRTVITVDPVSGDYVVFASGGQFYIYNVLTDTWTLQATAPPAALLSTASTLTDVVATPVDTYGVILFLRYNFAQSKVYLYKHAPSVPDTQAPTIPSNLTATPVSSSQINLAWTAATDNSGVTGYRIFQNGTQIGTAATLTYQNTGLSSATAYTYTVAAYDAANNQSAQSVAASAITLPADTTAPTISMTAPASGTIVTGAVPVSAAATDDRGVVGVQFKVDGVNVGVEDTTAAYAVTWDSTTVANGTHNLTAVARDAAGNTKTAPVLSVTVNNPTDTTAPTPPANPAATATSSSQVNLSWGASTDALGVTQYRVERCTGSACTNFVQMATPTGTSYNDTGLTADTAYRYRVRAADAAGNVSAYSSIASVTTQTGSSQGLTFVQKCAQPGVLSCFDFDNESGIRYNWQTGTSCDAALAGKTRYNWFSDRRATAANTVATLQNTSGACYFPQIDNSVSRSGGGSLKYTIPSNSSADTSGYFTEVYKRNTDGTFPYIAPGSPYGNVVYFQYSQRFDPNFQSINYQCIGGSCGGWKQAIYYGNPPNGSSSSLIEVTHNNGWQRNVPHMYGQQGHDDYGVEDVAGCTYAKATSTGSPGSGHVSRPNYMAPLNPTCAHYAVNQWMEFTVRVEVNGASNGNSPTSRVQMWVDGRLVIDNPAAKINWGSTDGDGLGQIMLTPYHTNKDSSHTHAVGYTWYDDLIISTQPIPMSTGGTASLQPPTGLVILGN